MAQLVRKRAVWNLVSGLCKYSAAFPHQNMVVSKGDGGVGTFDVGGEGPCLHFWFKPSNFLGARLISDRNS